MSAPEEKLAVDDEKRKQDAVAKQQLLQSFSGKMCPYLSIAGLRSAGSPLVGALGVPVGAPRDGEAISCQGPNCMKFVATVADKEGRVTAGACADALLPSAILQLRDANLHIAEAFVAKYKIRPI